jgi:hypothetical protein
VRPQFFFCRSSFFQGAPPGSRSPCSVASVSSAKTSSGLCVGLIFLGLVRSNFHCRPLSLHFCEQASDRCFFRLSFGLGQRVLAPTVFLFSIKVPRFAGCDSCFRFPLFIVSRSPLKSMRQDSAPKDLLLVLGSCAHFSLAEGFLQLIHFLLSCASCHPRTFLLRLIFPIFSFSWLSHWLRGLVSCSDFLLPAQIRCRSASSTLLGIGLRDQMFVYCSMLDWCQSQLVLRMFCSRFIGSCGNMQCRI